jgi:hypothetical protein
MVAPPLLITNWAVCPHRLVGGIRNRYVEMEMASEFVLVHSSVNRSTTRATKKELTSSDSRP